MQHLKQIVFLCTVLCIIILIHNNINCSHSYDTIDQLFKEEILSEQAEIQLLNLTSPNCYAVYNSEEESIFFLQIGQTPRGFQIDNRSNKVGYPVENALVPKVSGTMFFSSGGMEYCLCKNVYVSSNPKYRSYKTISFSNATLFYLQIK